jgi:organic hydroperoxide reductase OsmC/OhrA
MTTSKITYQGDLRTTAIHLQSNNEIITDAPIDNQGKGEAFSPTDLLATSLASCILTIIGIKHVIWILISQVLRQKSPKLWPTNQGV